MKITDEDDEGKAQPPAEPPSETPDGIAINDDGPSTGPVGRPCRVPGCNTDVAGMKSFNWRYRICETHRLIPSVIIDGVRVRFCQMCAKFHELSEFEGEWHIQKCLPTLLSLFNLLLTSVYFLYTGRKMSCRKKLDGHNARRRVGATKDNNNSSKRKAVEGAPSGPPAPSPSAGSLDRPHGGSPDHPSALPTVTSPASLDMFTALLSAATGSLEQQQQHSPHAPLVASLQQQSGDQNILGAILQALTAATSSGNNHHHHQRQGGGGGGALHAAGGWAEPTLPWLEALTAVGHQQSTLATANISGESIFSDFPGTLPPRQQPSSPPQQPQPKLEVMVNKQHGDDHQEQNQGQKQQQQQPQQEKEEAHKPRPAKHHKASSPAVEPPRVHYDPTSQLHRMSIKLFGCNPSDLDPGVKNDLDALIAADGAQLEAYVRPGCAHFTIDMRLPSSCGDGPPSASSLADIARTILGKRLVNKSTSENNQHPYIVQVGDTIAVGMEHALVVESNSTLSAAGFIPSLHLPSPPAVLAGENSTCLVRLSGLHIHPPRDLPLCRQHGLNITLDVVDQGYDDIDGTNSAYIDVRPLGLDPGCAEFEIEHGSLLSQPVPLLVLPNVPKGREAVEELKYACVDVSDAQLLRDIGIVLFESYHTTTTSISSNNNANLNATDDVYHTNTLRTHDNGIVAKLLRVCRARGWEAVARLLLSLGDDSIELDATPPPP